MQQLLALAVMTWLLSTPPALAQVRELPSPAATGSLAPNLFAAADGRVFLSWIDRLGAGRHALRFSVQEGDGWSTPLVIAEGANWFVNWADFPSLIALPDGSLAAHWLVKSGSGTYAYDVNVARSIDGGRTWSGPLVPHRDGTQTEHGFVSLFAVGDGVLQAVWLDGRETTPGADEHDHGGGSMTLRHAAIGRDGALNRETLLDPRVCDCCQTGAALTAEGPVVVYRDRSDRETRDIAIVRLREGRWTEPHPVAADHWEIHGCPVNGPAVAAAGRRVAVAWFTAADDTPRVKLAFSQDSGAGFDAPVIIDDGNPLGRVDAELMDDGSALVSWLESSAAGPLLRLRRVRADGRREESITVLPAGAGLTNGFPRMVRVEDMLVFAWTSDGVRTAVMPVPR
jgi:hypothetical protein